MGTAGCIAFLFGCVGVIVCVYTVPRMVIDGVLTCVEGILLACAMILMIVGGGALAKVAPTISTLLVLTFLFMLGALPYVRYLLRDRGNWAIAQQDIERYERSLAFDSSLNAARVALGDTYRELGLYDKAVEYYEDALDREPEHREAHKGLEECLKLQSVARKETWLCHICSAANDPRDERCFNCETPRGRLVRTPLFHRLSPWAFGGAQAVVMLLLVADRLSDFGALGATVLIAGAFYTLYSFDPTGDI